MKCLILVKIGLNIWFHYILGWNGLLFISNQPTRLHNRKIVFKFVRYIYAHLGISSRMLYASFGPVGGIPWLRLLFWYPWLMFWWVDSWSWFLFWFWLYGLTLLLLIVFVMIHIHNLILLGHFGLIWIRINYGVLLCNLSVNHQQLVWCFVPTRIYLRALWGNLTIVSKCTVWKQQWLFHWIWWIVVLKIVRIFRL